MLTNEQRVILEQNLYEGLEEEGKIISESSMKKVVEIVAKFDDMGDDAYWQDGFCGLYLESANFEADLTDLLEIKKVDEAVGWFMGRDNLEHCILVFKAHI